MRTHRVRHVYVNLISVWECRRCGWRWHVTVDYRLIEQEPCRGAFD